MRDIFERTRCSLFGTIYSCSGEEKKSKEANGGVPRVVVIYPIQAPNPFSGMMCSGAPPSFFEGQVGLFCARCAHARIVLATTPQNTSTNLHPSYRTDMANRWQEQLPLFVADVAVHLRTSLLRATNPMTLMSLARDACRRICTRDVREAFHRRNGHAMGSNRK